MTTYAIETGMRRIELGSSWNESLRIAHSCLPVNPDLRLVVIKDGEDFHDLGAYDIQQEYNSNAE